MAISAPTQLDHKHTGSGSTIVSNSSTFTSGRLYVVAVGGSGTTGRTASSISNGAGVSGTWTEANGGTDSSYTDGVTWATTLFTSIDASGTGTITGNFSGSWSSSTYIHVFEIASGFDTSGTVVQSVAGSQAPTATQATCNLADSGASGNMRLGYFVHRVQEALTAANSGTLVGAQSIASPVAVSKALWYYDGDTTSDPSVTWSTNSRGAVYMGVEIKASSSGVTGTAAWTEGADTSAASGTFTTTGTAAWTEGADTSTASGWITVTGTAAWTEGADTIAASGVSAQFVGPAVWTEGADTAAGSGTFTTTGTAAWTEGADTASGAGTVINPVTGTAAWTEGADTSAASGTFTTTGTSAWTEGADTAAGSGTYTPPAVTGTAAWTEGADTCSAAGVIPVIPPIGAVVISALHAASVAPTALRPYDVRVSAERPYLVKPTAERPYLVRVTAEHTGAVTVEAEGV